MTKNNWLASSPEVPNLHTHWLQILQQLKPMDKVKWYNFCCNFLEKLYDDGDNYQQVGLQ